MSIEEEGRIINVFQCGCFTEGVSIERDEETDEFYLVIWYRGRQGLPLKEKLKDIWRTLTHPSTWVDEIIWDRKTLIEFRDEINRLLKEKIISEEITRCPNCNEEVRKENEHFVDGYTPYEHYGWRCKKK